jgi:hypothetical protein
MSDQENELDRAIDAALSTYADPGPDFGLEARLMARINTARIQAEGEYRHRGSRSLWACGALAAAACTVLLIAPWRSASPHAAARITARERPEAVAAAGTSIPQPGKPTTAQSHIAGLHATAHNAPPKLGVFPIPTPLTGEEQALVHFATQNSEAQVKSLLPAEQPADAPIDIAAISIPPIKPPSEGKE